jgi:putative DNA methylase
MVGGTRYGWTMSNIPPDVTSARLIETWFPFAEVSRLVQADRRSRDPIYGVHKWFARRPPTLVRALLLASHLAADTDPCEFWAMQGSEGDWLHGAVVYDPFMGGGTSLVESARMGAAVVGRDVDPIAVAVVGSELHPPTEEFAEASDDLISHLSSKHGGRFSGVDPEWMPLHWFWLMRPICNECGHGDLLYKDLVLATSSGRHGSVVRNEAMHAFCPDCLRVQGLGSDRVRLDCCGKRHRIADGTYSKGRYCCPNCGTAATHEELQTGQAERVLIAVEETKPGSRRRIRSASPFDRELATQQVGMDFGLSESFDVELDQNRRDRRPVSLGFTTTRSLFTPRQWAVFTSAFAFVRQGAYQAALERELTLMLTGSLSSNNVLCGYARDWGRLAPLFSVRGFSLPALSVELNPFHPTAGRGTFRSARGRISERSEAKVRRARVTSAGVVRELVELPVRPASVRVECKSASDSSGDESVQATVCVTDPPYFDYIAYSELSEFFRAWLPMPGLAGAPLLPSSHSPVESFGWGLSQALMVTIGNLQPEVPLVFTYHSSNKDAWRAIGLAFDKANLAVVNLWPVLADPHMGHHSSAGNCEWDVVVVARRKDEVDLISGTTANDHSGRWLEQAVDAGFQVGISDQASFEHAWAMAGPRFGRAKSSRVTDDDGETDKVMTTNIWSA